MLELLVRTSIERLVVGLLLLWLSGCSHSPAPTQNNANKRTGEGTVSIKLTSTAFQDGGMIPAKYTCDGQNVSPPLNWSGTPANVQGFALVCEDPDAPGKTWVHWVVYDLPSTITQLPEAAPAQETLASGGKQGKNDFGKIGYGGPCPPSGTHRYFFRLYALDKTTDLKAGATKDQLMNATEGHIIGQGELMGRYKR